MSVEDRLRRGLARNAASFVPDVESTLERVAKRRRRRSLGRLVIAGVAAAAAVVALLVFVQRRGDELRPVSTPVPTVQATAPLVQALTGRFDATVDAGVRAELPFDVAGRWVIELDADGTIRVEPPASYVGVVSAPLFQATPEQFRTSLFETDLCSGQPIGTYRWVLTDSMLRFTKVDDPCAGRVVVLTSQDWTSTS